MFTEKERLERALRQEEVDRPPCICPGGMMNMITTDLMDACGVTWPEAPYRCTDDGRFGIGKLSTWLL